MLQIRVLYDLYFLRNDRVDLQDRPGSFERVRVLASIAFLFGFAFVLCWKTRLPFPKKPRTALCFKNRTTIQKTSKRDFSKREMKENSHIPLVHAVPVPEEALSIVHSGNGNVEINIPVHAISSGFSFENDPPRVSSVTNEAHQRFVGYYFSKLKLPGLEISGVLDCNVLRALLLQNQSLVRTLILTDTPPRRGDTLYQHDLPKNVGLTFSGFPPVVQSITDVTWMSRVRVGQAVHAVCIPGRAPFMLESGGFTASRVQQLLNETSHMDGRCLILKDRKEVLKPKDGSRDLFDLGGCLIS